MTARFKRSCAHPRYFVVAAGALAAVASGTPIVETPVPQPILTNTLLAEAHADECFVDVGVDYPPINPDGTCPEGRPKTNESYIWGLTEESGKLWFGTMANTACIVANGPGLTSRSTPPVVCEYGQSELARTHPALPDHVGDWRPPSIYEYDPATNQLTRRTPPDPLIARTLGFRGAGSIDNIAFLGGQNLFDSTANVFAFEADTGRFLGSCQLTQYIYIRKWDTVDGVLYVGVGSPTAGAVLRWDGDPSSFAGNFCDDFTVVGHLTAFTANLTRYQGGDGQDRLAATTVPLMSGTGGVGTWISPPIGPDGLTPADADGWTMIWSPLDYDPDPIVARFGYSGGAEQSYDGWLYWGTIHLENSRAQTVHANCMAPVCFGPPQTPEEQQALRDGVYRTASLWRGRNLENAQTREIQLLYGESELPAYDSRTHAFQPTPTGWTPLYGHSGFDNPNNEYVWQMSVMNGRLYVGTYDRSIFDQSADSGADLWRFDSPDQPAVNEDYTGLGDRFNYGIRALITLDDGSAMMAGMANPFNLRPGGGWELRRLQE